MSDTLTIIFFEWIYQKLAQLSQSGKALNEWGWGGQKTLTQVESSLGTESGRDEWVLGLGLQEGSLVGRLAESEGLKEVGGKKTAK